MLFGDGIKDLLNELTMSKSLPFIVALSEQIYCSPVGTMNFKGHVAS